MDGIIVIDKEQGMTSHDVVAKLRKILGTKKIGHTGTLDPLATGVLVACVNKATKLVDTLTCDEKIYRATMKFGIQTDTGDITGNVISNGTSNVDEEKVKEVLKSFIGAQKQIPPMYSAIKINGKKLYEYARAGQTIERQARDIEIFDISDIILEGENLSFTIHSSKGTYIRTVCEDIAIKLGTCGTMTALRRLKSGKFNIEDAIKLEDASVDKIITMDKLFDNEIIIKDEYKKLIDGHEISKDLLDGIYKLYIEEPDKKFIGLGRIKEKKLKRDIIL